MTNKMKGDKYHLPLNVTYLIMFPIAEDGAPYPNRFQRRKAAAELRHSKAQS